MSLARLALRLAAYEALCPFATIAAGPWPTIAGKRVFDSRIDLIQSDDKPDVAAELEGKPILIVYTEEDVSTPYPSGKKVPDEQIVHLVVEAMIAAKGVVEVVNEDGSVATFGAITAPITDRQREALLDLLEATVRRLFDGRTRAPSGGLYSSIAMEVRQIESYPQRAVDRVTRMAARTIRFHVKVRPDSWPSLPVSPAATGLALLPEPLQSVAIALDPTSTAGVLCADIAALMPGAPALPPALQQIGIVTDLDRDPDNAAPTQVASVVTTETDPDAPAPTAPTNLSP